MPNIIDEVIVIGGVEGIIIEDYSCGAMDGLAAETNAMSCHVATLISSMEPKPLRASSLLPSPC
jgi:hypothetical protein